ncbi:demethoxyubiquinone hydroxylase family protein [Neoehrlichia mikurensis]|uniref:3-demethoxyubiquinol 3-hydroxylase n=1 Tax=Neoehrlichia mikurensis TaxID=89586 RepID=A0A9Q9BXB6_9RICK|nr:demethoxyubiquinone hydroxylase family protein [Neoehrlichia mikurensis]QXK92111.1 demethoxyubiquinone hydroxylase family protein [Neoehrlichia mikurensis]QXK92569.1 demethoxyubiquinone hydroxylase family protein [Neoehrlichia mikurensis]QXK93805.1 demethoxyubiquinone hydroxylase family protein [Neoehrlichia mikurensis]UTO55198.1 demethoxyubiquinone hydroxylase family protein [Neoehrlichia mikurensis]UTO56118.1 demethoxyubiquinone hydroxylase family protein [Neoehrlichia mikurensis]
MLENFVKSVVRVNHAGEYGAVCIYYGQEWVFKKNPEIAEKIFHMKKQEQGHFEYFNNTMKQMQVRPTFFLPIWHVMGVMIGTITAMMGEKSAMACTAAVEEVICEHYKSQLLQLDNCDNSQLKEKIEQFYREELEHHDIAIDHGAKNAFAYRILSYTIKKICKTAIALSKVL